MALLYSIKHKTVRYILSIGFMIALAGLGIFPRSVVFAENEVKPCPDLEVTTNTDKWPDDGKKYTFDVNTPHNEKCIMDTNQIKISVPFPGLGANVKYYFPTEYHTVKDATTGKDEFCTILPQRSCYYVSGVQQYIQLLYMFLISIIGITSTAMLVYGGYRYILARGNSSEIESAKEVLKDSIAGLAIGLLSYVVLFTLNPQITRVAMPGLPPIPPIEASQAAEELTPDLDCGKMEAKAKEGENANKYKMGVYCKSEDNACVIEKSSMNPDLYLRGGCRSELSFLVQNSEDKSKNGKMDEFGFDSDETLSADVLTCGLLDGDTLEHDDVGSKCYNNESGDKKDRLEHTCIFILPSNGGLTMDYKTRQVSKDSRKGTGPCCLINKTQCY